MGPERQYLNKVAETWDYPYKRLQKLRRGLITWRANDIALLEVAFSEQQAGRVDQLQ
jgi:hypothetical protein